jgi:hypothetical protein
MPSNQSAILLITYNFKMFMLIENLIKLSSFIDDKNSKVGSIKGIHTEKSHWQTGSTQCWLPGIMD